MRITLASVVPFLAAGLLGACHQSAVTEDEVAALTADSGESGQAEGALFATATDGLSLSSFAAPSPENGAAYVAAHIGARMQPPECVTATASGANVAVVFDNCTGPRGLRTIDGTLNLAFSAASGGGLQVDASASDFQLGGAIVELAATAIYTDDGTTQMLDVTTSTTGVGPLGYDFAHQGDYTVTWDGTCASVDGAWSTERGDRSRSTTADLTRCEAGCPSGTVVRNTIDDRTITVTFDGSATATWSSSTGRSGSIELLCTP